jgi:hypothetical protein
VATRIADAHERDRIIVAGQITSTRCVRHGSGPAFRCQLDDGSGTIGLLFLGRTGIPGFLVGTGCSIEGTVQRDAHGLVTWNPWYRLEACGSQWVSRRERGEQTLEGCDEGRKRRR